MMQGFTKYRGDWKELSCTTVLPDGWLLLLLFELLLLLLTTSCFGSLNMALLIRPLGLVPLERRLADCMAKILLMMSFLPDLVDCIVLWESPG